jgi:hypothetical protein
MPASDLNPENPTRNRPSERHRLIEERVTEARRRKIKPPPSTKHHQQLETTNEQLRRKTVRTKKDINKVTTQTSTNRIINNKSHKQHATLHVRRGSYTTSLRTNNHTPNQRDHGHRRNIHHVTWRLRFRVDKQIPVSSHYRRLL